MCGKHYSFDWFKGSSLKVEEKLWEQIEVNLMLGQFCLLSSSEGIQCNKVCEGSDALKKD